MAEKDKVIEIYREVLSKKRCRFPYHFFVGEQGKKYVAWITRYLIEDYLHIPVEKIPECVSALMLWKYRLRPPAQAHGWDFIGLIENAYPDMFKPWDFKQVSNGYWKKAEGKQRAIDAIRYIIEEQYQIPVEEIPKRVTYQFFEDNGLAGALNVFNQSTFEAMNAAYPGRFKPWEFNTVPLNYWQDRAHVQKAMDWLLFDSIGFSSYQEALDKLTVRHFNEHRMSGLFQRAFNSRMSVVQDWIRNQFESIHA